MALQNSALTLSGEQQVIFQLINLNFTVSIISYVVGQFSPRPLSLYMAVLWHLEQSNLSSYQTDTPPSKYNAMNTKEWL